MEGAPNIENMMSFCPHRAQARVNDHRE